MAVIEDTTAAQDAPAPPARRGRWIVLGAATLAAVLVLGAVVWFAHWRTHPSVFPASESMIGMKLTQSRPTAYFGVTYPDREVTETVTVDTVSPRLSENTAAASFAFFLCGPGGSEIGVIGSVGFANLCPDAIAVVHGTEFDPSQQLVIGVTAHQPGQVRTDGIDLTYTDGWQHGTQTLDTELRITSR